MAMEFQKFIASLTKLKQFVVVRGSRYMTPYTLLTGISANLRQKKLFLLQYFLTIIWEFPTPCRLKEISREAEYY